METDGADCPICFKAWSSDGPHRICCINPCGHVYGRNCLENWLICWRNSATCPQCSRRFKLKDIITLYPNPHLWHVTKENWDAMRSNMDNLHSDYKMLITKLNDFEGMNVKMIAASERMLDATEARMGEKIDGNFKKMIELCKASDNDVDISTPTAGEAPLPSVKCKFQKRLDAFEEKILKNIDDNLKKVFVLYSESSSPNSGPAPSDFKLMET